MSLLALGLENHHVSWEEIHFHLTYMTFPEPSFPRYSLLSLRLAASTSLDDHVLVVFESDLRVGIPMTSAKLLSLTTFRLRLRESHTGSRNPGITLFTSLTYHMQNGEFLQLCALCGRHISMIPPLSNSLT